MRTLTFRASNDVVERLDALRATRGLKTRTAALRVAIREASPTAAPSVADRRELLRLLTERARDGSVAAMKALLEELRRDGATGGAASPIDELAARRGNGDPG
jgi:hypothetical protein